MANGIDWFRWHHGSVNDPKFGLVAKKAGARVGDVIAVWALLLEQASAHADRGTHGAMDCDATDFLLGADEGTTARILAAMAGRGLIGDGRIVRWEERQPKRERTDTTAAERKRAQRERDSQRDDDTNGDDPAVTPSHAMSHQLTPREEKSREELKNPPIPPEGGEPGEQKRKAAVSRRSFLDDCRSTGTTPIPDGHPVFAYADKVALPRDFLALQWVEFKDRYQLPDAKRYKDWRTVFLKSVKGNWFKLWFVGADGQYALTTVGQQAQLSHREAA